AADVPLLMVATSRPELYERAPEWAGGKRNATTIALAPLSDAETGELMSELLGESPQPEGAQQLLLERVGGNPLYAEEFARWLGEGGSLADFVPENVQAVIAARLDTLPAERKELVH